MKKRSEIERIEREILSEFATKASSSKGREIYEEEDDIRTCFQRDRDRIIHSKAFRRLMHKTQVFLSPEGDHYRTRLTHTLEVSQIARTIARGLGLNEDLTEAIALGHDLGHTPFGHNGEMVLDEIHPSGFRHNVQSLRVVDVLETGMFGRGMNLTFEVRDGILNHTGSGTPSTPEGMIVKTSDRIAYINHDIDDALRSGVLKEEDLPSDCLKYLGKTHRERISRLVTNMIENSDGKKEVSLDKEVTMYMNKLRKFMFASVYHNEEVKKAEDLENVEKAIRFLYNYFLNSFKKLPEEYRLMKDSFSKEELVKDYVAGMTDRYALNLYNELK